MQTAEPVAALPDEIAVGTDRSWHTFSFGSCSTTEAIMSQRRWYGNKGIIHYVQSTEWIYRTSGEDVGHSSKMQGKSCTEELFTVAELIRSTNGSASYFENSASNRGTG